MDLEVEVMLENHPHLFVVEVPSLLESPKVGDSMTCKTCGYQGKVEKVGTPGRKPRQPKAKDEGQQSLFKE